MKKIAVFDKNLKEVKTIELSDSIFNITPNQTLIHQVMKSMLLNLRRALAHTKTRSDVRGGGRKPWKQKGTGRARQGSIRSPLWAGGGITFGPRKDRNFFEKINNKMKQKAFCMLLSNKVDNNLLLVVDTFNLEKPKTKDIVDFINKTSFEDKKSILFYMGVKDENIFRAIRNIPNTKAVSDANVLDLLKYKNVVVTESVLNKLSEIYQKRNFKNKEGK